MGVFEILLIVVCVAFVGTIIATSIIKKKKNKGHGCSGGCDCCPYCSTCSSHKSTFDKKSK